MPGPSAQYADEASDDLRKLEDYIAERDGENAAQRVTDRIMRAADNLALMPRMGRLKRGLEPGTRAFAVRHWMIYYDILPDAEGVHVLRVIDGRRDLDTVFRRSERP
jgi:toxin ParE1/3/4